MYEFKIIVNGYKHLFCEEIEENQLEGWETKGDMIMSNEGYTIMMTRNNQRNYESIPFDTIEELRIETKRRSKEKIKGYGNVNRYNGKYYLLWITTDPGYIRLI